MVEHRVWSEFVLSGIEVVAKVGKMIGESGDVLATASPSI